MRIINFVKNLINDILRCVFIGLLIAIILGVIAILFALLCKYNILQILYRTYFYAGSLLVFHLSGLIPLDL